MAEQGLDIIIRAVDKASGVLKGVEKDLKAVGSPGTTKGVDAAGVSLASLGTIAKGFMAAGTLVAIANGMKDAFDATVKWGASVDQLGDMFGMSGQEASTWSVAMQHVGLSVQEGGAQLNYFTRMLSEAGEKMAEGEVTPFSTALDKLGVSAQGAGGKLKSFDDLMPEIMDAFKSLPAGVDATRIAMEMFGARGGSKFLDFLRQGSAGLLDADAKARAFGLSMSTVDSDKIEEIGKELNTMGTRFEGLKVSIGLGLVDPLLNVLRLLNSTDQKIELMKAHGLGFMASEAARWDKSFDPAFIAELERQKLVNPYGTSLYPQQPFGDAGARWGGAATGMKGQLASTQLQMEYRSLLQSMMVKETSGSASDKVSEGIGDFASLLAKAFGGNLGAAQGWQGAFASQHGGAAAGITDIRDKMAGDAFFARTGRAATDEEWQKRYYSGGFEGEDKTGLDAIFGPAGTLATKLDEQKKADDENAKALIAAMDKVRNSTLTVQFAGGRITDPGGGSGGASGRRDNTPA